jgi:hypothetical protein
MSVGLAGRQSLNRDSLGPSYFLAQKCVFKEKRAPRGSMELIRQDAKGPLGEPVGRE